jgi:hypothetical protein
MAVDWDAAVLQPCHDVAFGEPAIFRPVGAPALDDVIGIFFDGYTRNVDLGESVGVTTVKPVFVVRVEQFAARAARLPKQSDGLFVKSVSTTYVIKDVQPDGVGELRLELHKVSSP